MNKAFVAGVAVLLLGCAGDLVVRAPGPEAVRGDSPLAALPSLAVRVEATPSPGGAVGERAAGPFSGAVAIELVEPPEVVLQRMVVGELRAAGHRPVDAAAPADVALTLAVESFRVDAPRASPGWDVQVSIRMTLRVARRPGDEAFTEFAYSAERSGESWLAPGVGRIETLVAECLADLAGMVVRRDALSSALERYAKAP